MLQRLYSQMHLANYKLIFNNNHTRLVERTPGMREAASKRLKDVTVGLVASSLGVWYHRIKTKGLLDKTLNCVMIKNVTPLVLMYEKNSPL